MPSPCFEFFEIVAEELSREGSRVLTPNDLQLDDQFSTLLDELKSQMNVSTSEEAIEATVVFLTAHFASKGGDIPFSYDKQTGRFSSIDADYLRFVTEIKEMRTSGKRAKEFELSILNRLKKRATGSLHRVGFPRNKKKTKKQFNDYLKGLGFNGQVLVGKEKDGGFDILWALPLGSIPHQPIISVQCKNGRFKLQEGDLSWGPYSRSMSEHTGLQVSVHVPCVLFNDYIHPEILSKKRLNFVPLGLSDLTKLKSNVTAAAI